MGAVINEINSALSPIVYRQNQNYPLDRRSHQRFPLQLKVRYRNMSPRRPISGTGTTVNISSGGLLVKAEDEVPHKCRLEITLEWPSLLNGEVPLQLVVEGRVVRSEDPCFVVAILHHEFRTMKRSISSGLSRSRAALA